MKALILMYHRVGRPDVDPWSLFVSPAHFSEQMEALRKAFLPCSLTKLVEARAAGEVPANAVAVTFDDGYLDNLTDAKPILETHDVPATVFVSSGGVGRREEFWWDQLERALLSSPKKLPDEIEVAGKRFTRSLEDDGRPADGDGWNARHPLPHAVPRSMFLGIWEHLQGLAPAAQADAMRQIREWAGTPDEPRRDNLTLSADDLVRLGDSPLIEIGAHTVNHPLLPAHSPEFQRREIVESRSRLEEIIQRPVRHFAYPYGGYDQTSVEILREAGFASACTTVDRAVTRRSLDYELPRVTVHDWTGEQFLDVIRGKLADTDIMSRELDAGEQLVFPLRAFKSGTGDGRGTAIECIPTKHLPGHCLYGPDFVISDPGAYRVAFAVEQDEPEDNDDVVFDVYESRRKKGVLAEAHLEPCDDKGGHSRPLFLEFRAEKGYSVEFRVYWRGRNRLRITGVGLQRLS